MTGQCLRPAGPAEQTASTGLKFAQVKLFWLIMREVKVTTRPSKTPRRTDRFKTARSVASAAVLGFINETLHDQHRMLPAVLPIHAQATQAQAKHARGKIGIALPLRQDQEAAVVYDESKAARPLARTPSDPSFTSLQVQRASAEANESKPLSVKLGHVTE